MTFTAKGNINYTSFGKTVTLLPTCAGDISDDIEIRLPTKYKYSKNNQGEILVEIDGGNYLLQDLLTIVDWDIYFNYPTTKINPPKTKLDYKILK